MPNSIAHLPMIQPVVPSSERIVASQVSGVRWADCWWFEHSPWPGLEAVWSVRMGGAKRPRPLTTVVTLTKTTFGIARDASQNYRQRNFPYRQAPATAG